MRKVLLVLVMLSFGFANANTDPKVEDLSLLPNKSEALPFVMCSRINDAGTWESVGLKDNSDMAYWIHQVSGMTINDTISVGYAVVKCNAWEAHAKLTKADD